MAKRTKPGDVTGTAAIKRALLSVFQQHPTRNFNHKQVSKLLQQHDPVLFSKHFFIDDRSANQKLLLTLMSELVLSGDLLQIDAGRLKAVPVEQFIEGKIDITASGAAYVINENFEDDIYISQRHTGNAMNGDTVRV